MPVTTVATALGSAAYSHLAASLDDFLGAVLLPAHPLRVFLTLALGLRRNPRTRRGLEDFDAAVRLGGALPRWVTAAVRAAYGLYCSARSMAAPRARQPSIATGHVHGLHVPRALARVLSQRGVHWLSLRDRRTIRQRGTSQAWVIWVWGFSLRLLRAFDRARLRVRLVMRGGGLSRGVRSRGCGVPSG